MVLSDWLRFLHKVYMYVSTDLIEAVCYMVGTGVVVQPEISVSV